MPEWKADGRKLGYSSSLLALCSQVHKQLPYVIGPNSTRNWVQDIGGLLGEKNSYSVGMYKARWTELVSELEKERNANLASNSTSWRSHILNAALTLVSVNSTAKNFSVRADPNALLGDHKKFWADRSDKMDLSFCDINADLKKVNSPSMEILFRLGYRLLF